MTYQIIARKYRPKTFDQIIGQKPIVQTLKNAVESKRIAQAYIFSGMRGVGKTSAARVLAKALNCKNGPTVSPCNECEFCMEINEDRAIDVIEIDGASNRGIDEVRQLREGVRYKAIKARYKVIIIDEVHMLTAFAFNALLKTLEEPPPQTIFIFATTEFHKVPATIVSRCQHFEFKKISHRDIINHLLDIAKAEDITISAFGLSLIADASDGSLRDAQSLLDQAVAFSGPAVNDEDLKEILGTVSRSLLLEFSGAVLNQEPQSIFALVEKVVEHGYDLKAFHQELIQHFRDLLLIRSVPEPKDLLALSPEDMDLLKKETSDVSAEDLLRYLIALQGGEQALKFSSHPQITLEAMLVKLCHFKSLISLNDILKDLQGLKREDRPKPPAPPRPVKNPAGTQPPPRSSLQPQPAAGAAVRPDVARDILPKTVEALQKEKSSLAAILAQYSSFLLKDDTLDIKFSEAKRFVVSSPVTLEVYFPKGKGFIESIARDLRRVEKAASEVSGLKVKVKLLEEETPGQPVRESPMDMALKDANVKQFMDKFKAQILSVDTVKGAKDRE